MRSRWAVLTIAGLTLIGVAGGRADGPPRKLPEYRGLEDLLKICNQLLSGTSTTAKTPDVKPPQGTPPKPDADAPEQVAARLDKAIKLALTIRKERFQPAELKHALDRFRSLRSPAALGILHPLLVAKDVDGPRRQAAWTLFGEMKPELIAGEAGKGRMAFHSPGHLRLRAFMIAEAEQNRALSKDLRERRDTANLQVRTLRGATSSGGAEAARDQLIALGEEFVLPQLLAIVFDIDRDLPLFRRRTAWEVARHLHPEIGRKINLEALVRDLRGRQPKTKARRRMQGAAKVAGQRALEFAKACRHCQAMLTTRR